MFLILLGMPNLKIKPKTYNDLSLSLQDYLEAIGFLIKKNKIARVKDIAEILNVKLSSVTGALRQLKEKGYIKYSPYSFISLTEKGDKVATTLINAHKVLKELFMEIFLIEESESENISCVIEHYISEKSLKNIEKFLKFAKLKKLQKEFKEFNLK